MCTVLKGRMVTKIITKCLGLHLHQSVKFVFFLDFYALPVKQHYGNMCPESKKAIMLHFSDMLQSKEYPSMISAAMVSELQRTFNTKES